MHLYRTHLEDVDPADIRKDAKTQLQEHLQSRKQNVPEYKVISETGSSHEPEFTVSCKIDLFDEAIIATGKSKRKAEQAVAKQVVTMLELRENN